jgi:putative IMPACT (imprinted ancient) family translation regulator
VIIADCHDDGEVHKTAGEPILNVLGNRDMINILLVVTRFYGRIHLGPAGLIRRYSGTARDLLDNIELISFKR